MFTTIFTYFYDISFIMSMYYFYKQKNVHVSFETVNFGMKNIHLYINFEILYKSFQRDLRFVISCRAGKLYR